MASTDLNNSDVPPNMDRSAIRLGSVERASMDHTLVRPNLLILVCTYNERENLPLLFEQLQSVVPTAHILVVDDNSPDQTGQWVEEQSRIDPRIHLIARPGKQGLGTAIRDGMNFGLQHGYQWLINLDGDLSHDPRAIHSMLRERESCDLAIGSRYVPGGGMVGCSWRRIGVSRCANILARLIVGWRIRDCSSAYRMYRFDSLRAVRIDELKETGYGYLEEILAHLIRSGAKIVELPIIYTERRQGKSKNSLREARSTFSALLRCAQILKHQ